MDLIEVLEASGLKPIIVNENTDIEAAVRRRETNEEFMVRIMNFGCPTGALIQMFIIEALRVYATDTCSTVEQPANWPSLISFNDWKATGIWLKAELVKRYG